MQEPFFLPHVQNPASASDPARRRRAFVLILVLFLATEAAGQTDGESARTLLIGKISVVQRNVFDDSSTMFLPPLGSLANYVHVLTDEDVIRRELLFKEGEPYDPRLLEESGLNLRRLEVVGDVVIASDTLPDNTVHVIVNARDRWTLRPAVSLRQQGDQAGFAVTVREDNFLGNAQRLRLGYSHLSGPGNPHGGEIAFTEPRLWGSRWSATVHYGMSQEYRAGAFSAECPFYSTGTPWAARLSAGVSRTFLNAFHSGVASRWGYIDQENQLAWFATSSRADAALQMAAAYLRTRAHASGVQVRPFENADFLIGAISLLSRHYETASSADYAGRTDDVPLGYQAGVALGRNLRFTKAGKVITSSKPSGSEA